MMYKKSRGIRPDSPENEYVESIVDILDEEMAAASTNPVHQDTSNGMDLLVSDLLKYLEIEDC